MHLNLVDQRARHWIENETAFPEAIRTLLLAKDVHQSALVDQGFLGCVLHDFERDFDARIVDRVGALRFVLGPRFIVTARHHPLRCADIIRGRIAAGARVPTAATALDLLVDAVIEAETDLVRGLNETVLKAEDDLLDDGRSPDARAMANVRRRAVQLHRLLGGMRAVFQRIEQDEDLPEALLPTVERVSQRILAVDADVVATQTQLRLLRDEMDSQAAQRTNQNLYVLSILTALVLPATFITGIFGMNTGGLPWATSPIGTLLAGLLAVASAAAVWMLLRALGLARR
ncbi:CorA family divalent cation transporter [Sphingosinicella rhizophila]|uniref:CorA family divalent cation transporter n=1 Tax=Sphingosinicella rhizophila TaxID=3050082 RepID=A0ABU3Q8K2_9SPHN|nr:CorA family divalent cation transporter [Sphingosinicella sp. GR2756]MDT9599308.1 CorA family divalent cation transporter [Sphingosinicella sp. GR2756]